jgi:hypothetical protein
MISEVSVMVSWLHYLAPEVRLTTKTDRKQRERKGPRTIYTPQGHTPSDLFPLAKPHLLKFLLPHKNVSTARDQTLKK